MNTQKKNKFNDDKVMTFFKFNQFSRYLDNVTTHPQGP